MIIKIAAISLLIGNLVAIQTASTSTSSSSIKTPTGAVSSSDQNNNRSKSLLLSRTADSGLERDIGSFALTTDLPSSSSSKGINQAFVQYNNKEATSSSRTRSRRSNSLPMYSQAIYNTGDDSESSLNINSSVNRLETSTQSSNNSEDTSDVVPPYMQHMTIILVILHMSVFITGLVGNSLVCLSVYRNKSLQTVTNLYIVNLAVADFLVILICLPPTVYWDLTLTWNFGLVLCKLVLYLQVSFVLKKYFSSTRSS